MDTVGQKAGCMLHIVSIINHRLLCEEHVVLLKYYHIPLLLQFPNIICFKQNYCLNKFVIYFTNFLLDF